MSSFTINRVVLVGRLTRDPELRALPSGSSVCVLRVACNSVCRDAGDLLFECVTGKVHVYAGDHTYVADGLEDEGLDHSHGLYYAGTLDCATES